MSKRTPKGVMTREEIEAAQAEIDRRRADYPKYTPEQQHAIEMEAELRAIAHAEEKRAEAEVEAAARTVIDGAGLRGGLYDEGRPRGHGGARVGAGRKRKPGSTSPGSIQLPAELIQLAHSNALARFEPTTEYVARLLWPLLKADEAECIRLKEELDAELEGVEPLSPEEFEKAKAEFERVYGEGE